MGTRHLYRILTGPSFAVRDMYLPKSFRRSLWGLKVWAYTAEIVSTVAEPASAQHPLTNNTAIQPTSTHFISTAFWTHHKVLTYVEYRAVSGDFQNMYWPPPPFPSASVSSPRTKGGGYTLARRWGGWGVNILEDARHRSGLLQYNLSTEYGRSKRLGVKFMDEKRRGSFFKL
jgi:hypothetical protein